MTRAVALVLVLCLGLAACAGHDASQDRQSGFYGGISGGLVAP